MIKDPSKGYAGFAQSIRILCATPEAMETREGCSIDCSTIPHPLVWTRDHTYVSSSSDLTYVTQEAQVDAYSMLNLQHVVVGNCSGMR